MPDPDRKRASSLLRKDATQRLLTIDEIEMVRDQVVKHSEGSVRGVALSALRVQESGKVLSWDETLTIIAAIDKISLTGVVPDRCAYCPCHHKDSCPQCTGCDLQLADSGVEPGGTYLRNSFQGPVLAYRKPPSQCACGDLSK